MEKGEGWRVFTWVGLMTFVFTHAQAQTQTFDSLQVGATWWWGDLDQWALDGDEALGLAEHRAVGVGEVHEDPVGEEDKPVVAELHATAALASVLFLEQPAVRHVRDLLL